jgi:hypothetical protein
MKHVIPHELDLATAKRVVDKAFEEYKRRFASYEPTLLWANDRRADVSFNAKGIKLEGAMLIEPKSIELDLDVPFLFRPFRKIAIEAIEREVRVWLEKARAGQL